MSSSGDKQMDTRDIRLVYLRKRRRILTASGSGSGKVVRDFDLNFPPPSEPSEPKTDGSFEIGPDSPLCPAPNLFQRATIIPSRKRSTMNHNPLSNPQPPRPPPLQECRQSHIVCSIVDSNHSHQLASLSTGISTFSPPPPSDHPESSADRSAPGKEWRCPTCLRIDVDGLSMPLKYLQKGIKKFEE